MSPITPGPSRSNAWKWWICGLLLCASTINYMDRMTLANASVRITTEFQLTNEQYGKLEQTFGLCFAVGSLAFGWLVDKIPVRLVYPGALLLWSLAGIATAHVHTFDGLLLCRAFLGFFEAGHWPCAVKTTQRLLEPKDRSLGNSLLQSGTSIGAIITPQIMKALMTDDISSWRFAFQIIGVIGLVWIIAWFSLIRQNDIPHRVPKPEGEPESFWRVMVSRRMVAILITIACINLGWQIMRAWLPRFLQLGRGYTETESLNFNSLFYLATDVGVLGAGALTVWLCKRGWSVHGSRLVVFFLCSVCSACTVLAAFSPKGYVLLAALMVAGAGALGVFGIYHALTQDISSQHQGKVSGLGGLAAWLSSPLQTVYGKWVDTHHSYDAGIALAGLLPLVACITLWLVWPKTTAHPAPTNHA